MCVNGFSIITATKRDYCINNLIQNYSRQNFKNKELIIIINNDSIEIGDFSKFSYLQHDINVYKLSEKNSLGECLNFAVSKCKYGFVAKFDDDDYYGPFYLNEMYNSFKHNDCDIVGKYKTYYYLEKYNCLMLKNNQFENQYITSVMGSTICFKKHIFSTVKFRDISQKEDYYFNQECIKNGYKIFANSCFNHIVFKHEDNSKHSFICNVNLLISKCIEIRSDISFEDCYKIIDKPF